MQRKARAGARPGTRPPAVVLLSTYDEDEFGTRAGDCGAVAYVAKSAFGIERLAALWALANGGA